MSRVKKASNTQIGQRIKTLRESGDYTQSQLAKLLNKTDSTVRMWELGYSEPDTETIKYLSNLFNTTADYLLGSTDDSAPILPPIPEELRDVAFAFHGGVDTEGLSEDDIEELKGFVRYLKNREKSEK